MKRLKKNSAEANNLLENEKVYKVGKFSDFWKQFKKNKGAMFGLVLLITIILITIVSSFVWDYDTDIIGMNSSERLMKPCA